jgi:hypothetical protein
MSSVSAGLFCPNDHAQDSETAQNMFDVIMLCVVCQMSSRLASVHRSIQVIKHYCVVTNAW